MIFQGRTCLRSFAACQSKKCTDISGGALVSSAPTEHMNAACFVGAAETAAPPEECRLLGWCSGDRCTP